MRRWIYDFCRPLARRRRHLPESVGHLHAVNQPIICNGFENSDRNMYPCPLPGAMMPDLEEVPRLRKALGLTQTALARLSNVSQSTIVKIEKKQMNPSYDVVRRVMASLQAELKRQEKRALVEQIQTRKVQYLEAKLPLESAVAEMRHWKFSQMPVMHNGHPVGSISDKVINNLILSGKDQKTSRESE